MLRISKGTGLLLVVIVVASQMTTTWFLLVSDSELPEVSFQLFLFDQSGHDGADQELVGKRADQEEAKNADESDPSSAEKKINTHMECRISTAVNFILLVKVTRASHFKALVGVVGDGERGNDQSTRHTAQLLT